MTLSPRLLSSVLLAAALLFACDLPSLPGTSDAGSAEEPSEQADAASTNTSSPGWTLSYPDSEKHSAVLAATFTPHQGNGTVESIPPADDAWRNHLTDRTFTLSKTNGDASSSSSLSLTIGDPTVTLHITGSASSGGTIVGGATGGISNATWCYRPPAGTKNVRFTTSSSGTVNVSGDNALASYDFAHMGKDCSTQKSISLSTPGQSSTCSGATIDVMVDTDGNACLDGTVDEPQFWMGTGGGDGAAAGGGSGSVDVTFTVTATPL